MTRPRIEEVACDVFAVQTAMVNWLLVREGRHVLAVDSGYPGTADVFMSSITQVAGVNGRLAAAIITHGHSDHQGGLARVQPDVPIYAHRDELPNAHRETLHQVNARVLGHRLLIPRVLAWSYRAIHHGGLQHCPVPAAAIDGAVIADLPGAPRFIAAPGHTPGHIAVALDEGNVVATGDALINGHPTVPRRDRTPSGELPALFHSDPEGAARTAGHLRESTRGYLHVPGHGAPYHLPAQGSLEQV